MKTPTPILIITLAATIIAFAVLATVIILSGGDPLRLFTSLAIAIPALGALFGIAQVSRQTNGTLTKLRAENSALHSVATPAQVEKARDLIASDPTVNPTE